MNVNFIMIKTMIHYMIDNGYYCIVMIQNHLIKYTDYLVVIKTSTQTITIVCVQSV